MGGGLLRREAILELVQSRRHPGRRPGVQTPTTNGRGSISFFYYIFDISDDFHEVNSDIYKLLFLIFPFAKLMSWSTIRYEDNECKQYFVPLM